MTKLEIFRDEEFYLVQRDGIYYIHAMVDGMRVRRNCQTRQTPT